MKVTLVNAAARAYGLGSAAALAAFPGWRCRPFGLLAWRKTVVYRGRPNMGNFTSDWRGRLATIIWTSSSFARLLRLGVGMLMVGSISLCRAQESTSDIQPIIQVGERGTLSHLEALPNGYSLVSFGFDGNVKVWDISNGWKRKQLEGSGRPILSGSVSPDGGIAVGGFADATVWRWDLHDNKRVPVGRHRGYVLETAFASDGTFFSSSSQDPDGSVKIWSVKDDSLVRETSVAHHGTAAPIAFLSTGHTLAIDKGDGTIAVQEPEGQDASATITVNYKDISRIVACGRNKILIKHDDDLSLWDVDQDKELWTSEHVHSAWDEIVCNSQNRLLAATSVSGAVLISLDTGRVVQTIRPAGPVTALCFSVGGDTLFVAANNEIWIYDVTSGREVRSFVGGGEKGVHYGG